MDLGELTQTVFKRLLSHGCSLTNRLPENKKPSRSRRSLVMIDRTRWQGLVCGMRVCDGRDTQQIEKQTRLKGRKDERIEWEMKGEVQQTGQLP